MDIAKMPNTNKPIDVYIEVCVKDEVSSTERGRILEKFARKFLETQNYKITEEVRITGMEIDLIAEEMTTGEQIIVECKAQRSTISANVLTNLYGRVSLENYSAGWLISTYDLGKDAKGIREKWSRQTPDIRRRLQIYDPELLIQRLIKSNFLLDPHNIAIHNRAEMANETVLILSQLGTYWAMIAIDQLTNIRRSVLLYDAHSGDRISNKSILNSLSATDSSLSNLIWEADDKADRYRESQRLESELQSVVRVQSGDDWSDYRPARPQDYIGREILQKDILELFEKIRNNTTQTRVFAIKAPSGWGKSSSVLKIADRAAAIWRGKKMFVYAVDSRAATSRRFVELVLLKTFKEAVQSGFVEHEGDISVGGSSNPFSTDSMRMLLNKLTTDKKIICLIFDQFEELLYREELSSIFHDVRLLCDAAIEQGSGFVVGFSWKTDGAVPPEHNAYHLWHSLADRRREFELGLFLPGEITSAINRLSKEINQNISPQLRRLLSDHCQGYPWLLKKLCIHIIDQIENGLDQSEILIRKLRIEELFSRDLENLNAAEHACVRQIAAEAPAEFFKIIGLYGDDVITSLLNKRLIIRSGSRLSIYWDIFRDYVINNKVPYIPTTYIPQININTYLGALRVLLRDGSTSYQALAVELSITAGTLDNLVRDMVVVGNAESDRKNGHVRALQQDTREAAKCITSFCMSHSLYRAVIERYGIEQPIGLGETTRLASELYARLTLSPSVLEQYAARFLQWCVAAGLFVRSSDVFHATTSSTGVSGLTENAARNRRGNNYFVAEATPEKSVSALRDITQNGASRVQIIKTYGKSCFFTLANLGLIDNRGLLILQPSLGPSETLREIAPANKTLNIVKFIIKDNPDVKGGEIANILARELGILWSKDTSSRHGNALRRWVGWCWPNEFDWKGAGNTRRLHPRLAE